MKQIGLLILAAMVITSCSVTQLSMTSLNSERGDAVCSRIVPDNNYGKSKDIHIYSWTQGGILNVNRVFIDFDLAAIPKNTTIKSASLSLYFNPNPKNQGDRYKNTGEDNIIIQRVISNWNESDLTWSSQPETTETNQIVITKKKNAKTGYLDIDVTNLIQDLVKDDNGRYGIMVRHQNEKPKNAVYFASSNHPNKDLHPKLEVSYKSK